MPTLVLMALAFLLEAALPAAPRPIPSTEFAARRAELSRSVGEDGMLLLLPAPALLRSADTSHEYRADSNVYYLTGIAQEGTAVVLMPGNEGLREILFLAPRDPAREIWDGQRLSAAEATAISGITTVWTADRLRPFLSAVLAGQSYGVSRYVPAREYRPFQAALRDGRARLWADLADVAGLGEHPDERQQLLFDLRQRYTGFEMLDIAPRLAALRQVKSAAEIDRLQRAIDITVEAHHEAMRRVRPGLGENALEATIEFVFRDLGGAGWAFPSIVGSGPNATTLHYIANNRRIEAGDLVLIDIGAEFDLYAADVTRTIPAGGRFTAEQAAIYRIVLEAQEAALAAVRPGATIPEVHARAVAVVRDGLVRLGLITGDDDDYRHFFMHGTCHWLGLDVHDVGDRDRPLEPGMVFTVEPGIYVRADAFDHLPPGPKSEALRRAGTAALRRYAGIGVRIEDDVLVTATGHRLMSGGAPRTIPEIEAAIAGRQR